MLHFFLLVLILLKVLQVQQHGRGQDKCLVSLWGSLWIHNFELVVQATQFPTGENFSNFTVWPAGHILDIEDNVATARAT